MSFSNEFKEFLIEHLAGFGPVTIRRMFGGGGIYRDGLMFGIIDEETVYLKVDDETRARFEAEGSEPFVYAAAKGKQVAMGYYHAPERCMDDAGEMAEWARLAYGAALRAQRKKSHST